MSGLLNAATLADDIIFRKNLSSDNWVKWFNIGHVCLMIAAAVILLVAVMTNHILSIQIWMGLFVVHIIGYYIAYHAVINVRNPFFSSALSTVLYVLVILLTLEGVTQILFRLMPEFLTIIAVFFLLTALTTNLIHLILITLTFEVTQLLYQFLYSIIATALNINVTVRMGVYSSAVYWGFISGWIAQVTQTVLQLVPDLLTVVASFVLLAAIISQYLPLFWVPMLMHLVQVTYLLVFSIISAAMGKNLIVNQSVGHNITYWIYVVAWLETFAVFWGVLHFVAANCLSVSLIMTSPTPVLVYIVIEGCFLAFTIVYVLQSAVMAIHLNANMCIGNCIVYWIFVGITWGESLL
ncbi:GL22903 [Drosophila persimilis]|uniref:GL22903 n=1 Tax=Drosophila persimilis TaxID=7234 RepID=B4H026_DROPE|nr:GL22903 [Drosophila persimilis]